MRIKRLFEDNLNLQELDKKDTKTGETRGQKFVKRLQSDQDFTVDKKTKICQVCDGKGYITNPDYDESDPESEETLDCEECKSTGEKKQRVVKQVNFRNNQEVVDKITTNDIYDKDKAKNYLKPTKNFAEVLKGEDNKDYKLNDIKKDQYFGSSKGSSLGIEKTRIVESLQCLFLSLRQFLGNENISKSDVEKLYDTSGEIKAGILEHTKVPIELSGTFVRDFIDNDQEKWVETFINTSNLLYQTDLQIVGKRQRTVFKPDKIYDFHQIGADTELNKALLAGYNNPESKGIPISKWTPSDVWAVESLRESNIIYKLRTCITIKDLNDEINSRFLKSQLIGLSLKKIGGPEKVSLVINKLTPAPRYTFDEIVTSFEPLGSTGIRLYANYKSEVKEGKNSMYLRSFSGVQTIGNISGEVDGSHSRYGKIGLGYINTVLTKCGFLKTDLIPTTAQIQLDNSYTDDFLIAEIKRINSSIEKKSRKTNKIISERPSLISKYQALRFAELMYSLSDDDYYFEDEDPEMENDDSEIVSKQRIRDKIVEDMFYYALSIKNYAFESPMYVRIISD